MLIVSCSDTATDTNIDKNEQETVTIASFNIQIFGKT